MFRRPSTWLIISLLSFAGAYYVWRLSDQWAAQRRAMPPVKAASAAPSERNIALAKTLLPRLTPPLIAKKGAPATAFRLHNSRRTVEELLRRDHAVLLENALFDTEQPIAPAIPEHLRAREAKDEVRAYIVQARGVVDAAFRASLQAAGADIVAYIPNNAFLVRATDSAANLLRTQAGTQTVLPYEPYYKLKDSLLASAVKAEPLPEGAGLNVLLFADTAAVTRDALREMGVEIVSEEATPFGPAVQVRPPVANWYALATLPGVQTMERTHKRAAANDLSRVRMGLANAPQTPTNYLNLTGTNVLIGVNDFWESSAADYGQHPDLQGRVTVGYTRDVSLVDSNGHATHIAGIIAGNGSQSATVTNAFGSINPGVLGQYRGMAPGARLYALPVGELSDTNLQQRIASTNILISNNSWYYEDSTVYGLASASYDAAVRDSLPFRTGSQPLVYVFAAGNDGDGFDSGNGAGADSISAPGTAKNVITVGAMEQPRNITNEIWKCSTNILNCETNTPWEGMTSSDSEVARFSGRGNVGVDIEGPFGRFKPDVVAPGTFVVSTRSPHWNEADFYNPTNITSRTDVYTAEGTNLNEFGMQVPNNAVGLRILVTGVDAGRYMRIRAWKDENDVGSADFNELDNDLIAPPEGGAAFGPVNVRWRFAIGNTNVTQTNRYVLTRQLITTNDFGKTYEVLSNLNNSISGKAPHYYRYESGTSMSAADVSGALALMQEFFTVNLKRPNPSPALMKALLINGARSVSTDYGHAVQATHNDQGWGLARLRNSLPGSLTNFNAGLPTYSMWFADQSPTNALATGQSLTRTLKINNVGGRNQPLRISLVWTDPPGNPVAAAKLVNDLDLIVTNLVTKEVFYGNNFIGKGIYTEAWDTNGPPPLDVVNNVENVYLRTLLDTNYSVTVRARRVNVNAVTEHPNDVVQDYALVISSGDGQISGALTVDATPLYEALAAPQITYVSNTFNDVDENGNPRGSGFLLDYQRVGANSPLLGLTNGVTNQWHFYVVTNTTSFTNAAFITFIPTDLSIPRIGTWEDTVRNATRQEADIDLYVSTDSNLTNLAPGVIASANKSRLRGGTEQVVYSNSVAGQVYYIGVKAEDQMAAEYSFFGVFSRDPFGDKEGNVQCYNLRLSIPDLSPDNIQGSQSAARIVCPCMLEGDTRRVIVTNNIVFHEHFEDLVVALTHGEQLATLSNHRVPPNPPVPPGPYRFNYEDNGEYLGEAAGYDLLFSDGPGSLRNFVGEPREGAWIFTFLDDALYQTGRVDTVQIQVEKADVGENAVTRTIQPASWSYDVINVGVGATNLTICISGNTAPIELYLRKNAFPTRQAYDQFIVVPVNGACLEVTSADLPPLSPGRYIIGIYNSSGSVQTVQLTARLQYDPSGVRPIKTGNDGKKPLLDDAVGNSSITITNQERIASVEVGVRIDHPRVSDLALTLISPRGTRVLLAENRGGTNTLGMGSSLAFTNVVPVEVNNGGPDAVTNVIYTGRNQGSVTIDYNFFGLADRMTVYYGAAKLLDTGFISGSGTFILDYGPGSATEIVIVMNEGGNTNLTTEYNYTVSDIRFGYTYLTFTEDTNRTTTPIKFFAPPFVPGAPNPTYTNSDFEFPPTTNGTYYGPLANRPDGWSLETVDPVTVVSNPPAANTGQQSLALRAGRIARPITTVAGRSYLVGFGYRSVGNMQGLVSWWPADDLTPRDVIGTNDGTLQGGVTFAQGEVAQGFQFNGGNSRIYVPDSPELRATNGLTLEAWINPSAFNADNEIMSKWDATNANQRAYTFKIDGSGLLSFAVSSDGGFTSTAFAITTNSLPLNQWSHVAGTYDGAALRIYVNGVFNAQAPWNLGIFPGNAPLIIGDAFVSNAWFAGLIDEPSVYNRALGGAEVAEIYTVAASGKRGLLVPPVGTELVGGKIFTSNGASNTFSGTTNWNQGGLVFTATGNSTLVGLAPAKIGGHFYEFVRTNGITWADAKAAASVRVRTNSLGLPLVPHLATITSAEENAYILNLLKTTGVNDFAWLGGRAPRNNDDWRWEAGPEANLPFATNRLAVFPFYYANWGTALPNFAPSATYLAFNLGTASGGANPGQWKNAVSSNQGTNQVVGYIVEYEPIPAQQSGVLVDTFTVTETASPLYVLPEESLRALQGEFANGEWTLEIWDSRTGQTNQAVLQSWQLQFVFQRDTPAPYGLRPGVPRTTTIPPRQIAYYVVDAPFISRFATNQLYNASDNLGFYFNQNIAPGYGATNSGDVIFASPTRNHTEVLSTSFTTPPASAKTNYNPGQQYYLAIENLTDVTVSYTIYVDFDLVSPPPPVILTNGVEYCTSNTRPFSLDYYLFTVSTNAVRAQFALKHPSADMTLVLRKDLPPSLLSFDYFSANPFTNDEVITLFDFTQPVPLSPGDWYFAAANLSTGAVSYCVQAYEWFVYGTNITITNIVTDPNSICLTWASLPGVYYYVEGVVNQTDTNWVAVSPTIIATGPATTYCIPLPTPFNFFRVREGVNVNPYYNQPTITSIERVFNGILIKWGGPTNAQYQVEWSPVVLPPVWTAFTNIIKSPVGLFQFLDDGSQTGGFDAMRYYRLVQLP